MAYRASSPALSENEFDIGAALFGDDDVTEKGASADIGVDLDFGDQDGSDDEAFIAATQAASNRKSSNLKGNTVKKGGGFQAMGLNATLLKSITKMGYKVPTPIQRRAVPLIMDRQDVVGMARTGSGKTAAFVIPMIQAMRAHSAKFGARAIILSPSRELALQTLKVVKDLGRGTDLRTVLVVGGESLDEQFSSMTSNPDIIIATPGRFLHLKVEMNLDLSSVRYIVFDEADRLFEMGFGAQLAEILHALPTSRQTLLFSATLPKTLVEFARAGLQEPRLIRMDDSKVSPDLENAFFTLKSAERDAALLLILDKIIKMPTGETDATKTAHDTSISNSKKRKRPNENSNPKDTPTPTSTIVFAATKHRVEYLASLLKAARYAVSYVYGALDQTARKEQVQEFRSGLTNILVVTDVAARGLDLPLLANVVNYDFPSQPKIFVHRVGRTARAGRKGWSFNLIRESDVPYLIDLQLFLGKRLVYEAKTGEQPNYAQDVVVGSLVQDELAPMVELVTNLHSAEEDLVSLQTVARKGEAQYARTRNSASNESVKRSKQLLTSRCLSGTHLLFGREMQDTLREKEKMLERISSFRPTESVFEVGQRGGGGEAAEIMRKRREQINKQKQKKLEQSVRMSGESDHKVLPNGKDDDLSMDSADAEEPEEPDSASDSDDVEITVSQPASRDPDQNDWQNSEFFMSYTPKGLNVAEEKGYGVHSGSYNTQRQSSNFVESARAAQMDLANDEVKGFAEASKARGLRWDKKGKKYVARANDEDGSKGSKMVTGESGLKIAASYRSGRFHEWRKTNKIRLPRVGEIETANRMTPRNGGHHYKHKAEKAPKEADRYRDDYHVQKQKVADAKEKRIGKFRDGSGKSELKGVDDVRKQRQIAEKKRDKNARPTKKRKV